MSTSRLAPIFLKTNNLTNPVGIPAVTPDLSWRLSSADGGRQSAWRVCVMEDGSKAPLWESGWQAGDSRVCAELPAALLAARRRYQWQVKVKDETGAESDWSEPAVFETGLACEADWQGAIWIGQPAEFSGHAICFRRLFKGDGGYRAPRLYISGLGWSEAWVNGTRLGGDAVLQPPQTDYGKSYSYLTYDLTGLLREGVNALAVHVGAGWHGAIRLRYLVMDGDMVIDRTDFTHLPKLYRSPVCRHSVFDGEEYDARQEWEADWTLPDGHDLPGHRPAFRLPGPTGTPRGLEEEPIRPQGALKPIEWRKLEGEGHYSADFGQNFAGWCRLKVTAHAGTRISLRHSEFRHEDGTANWANLLDAEPEDIYIAKGDANGETFEPHFTYHGFRYVEVSGLPYPPTDETLMGIPVRNDCRPTGRFECSNPLLNDIWKMVRATEASNIHAVPTDCPQRNERMGWLNDMMARCETALYLFDETNVHTKWLRDIAEAQDPATGEVPMTAPAYWGFDTDPVCSSFVEAAYLGYAFCGKKAQLKELYPAMRAWIDRMASRRDPDDGIFRPGGIVGDWVPPIKLNNGQNTAQNKTVPPELVSTALMHYATRLLAKIAAILQDDAEVKALTALADQMQTDFLKAYRCAAGRLNPESQSAYAYACYCGLFPTEERPMAAARLAELFQASGCKHSTGNIGTKYLLETLTKYGYAELAYALVASRDYPSWGYMLDNGATTLWERWELCENDGMNSHNHPMLGCPGGWLMRHVAGIQLADDSAAFTHFVLAPTFFKELTWAQGDFDSSAGPVRARWERTADGVKLDFEVPDGATAKVRTPDGTLKDFMGGKHHLLFPA